MEGVGRDMWRQSEGATEGRELGQGARPVLETGKRESQTLCGKPWPSLGIPQIRAGGEKGTVGERNYICILIILGQGRCPGGLGSQQLK